ncbi:universal stress protein [Roseivirga echinicomitans]
MKKIIVPVDFSNCSKNALLNAIIVAERMNMELVLLHSFMLPMATSDGTPLMVGSMIDDLQNASESRMTDFVKENRELKRVKFSTEVTAGLLLASLNDALKNHDTAYVIMGTYGASGLKKAFIGSNAYTVIKNVKRPVIALPEDADITKMKRIAMSGDYKQIPSAAAIESVIKLTQAFFAHLYIIHIDQDKALEQDELEIAKGMEKYFKKVPHSFHFKRDYDVEDGLLAFAKEEDIDLLVMISRHHSLIDRITRGSETKRMVMDIPMPLMILSEPK